MNYGYNSVKVTAAKLYNRLLQFIKESKALGTCKKSVHKH